MRVGGPDDDVVVRDDPLLRTVFTTADAVALGLTQEQCEQRVRSRRWRRLRRGVFCLAGTWDGATPEARHLLVALATARAGADGDSRVLSHATAAVIHGLPVPHAALEAVHVTRPPGRRRMTSARCRTYRAALPADEVVVRDGVLVTSVPRTVADCLRHRPRPDAVALADAALHSGRTNEEKVRQALQRQTGWPWAGAAGLTMALVDGRRESPLESRSAVVMADHGIPTPVLQWQVRTARGDVMARVDFAWPELGVVGEADGRTKYTGDAARVVEAEKDRQALLETLGLVVVRWDERHLHGPEPALVGRLNNAFLRARRRAA